MIGIVIAIHVNGGRCLYVTNNFATNMVSMRMLYDICTTLAQKCPAVYTLGTSAYENLNLGW